MASVTEGSLIAIAMSYKQHGGQAVKEGERDG